MPFAKFLRDLAVTIRRVYSPRWVVIGKYADGHTFESRVWAHHHGDVDSKFRFKVKACAEHYAATRNRVAAELGDRVLYFIVRSWEV